MTQSLLSQWPCKGNLVPGPSHYHCSFYLATMEGKKGGGEGGGGGLVQFTCHDICHYIIGSSLWYSNITTKAVKGILHLHIPSTVTERKYITDI